MTARDRLLLKFVAPIIVLGAFYFLVLSPKLSDMKTAKADVATAQANLTTAQAALATQRSNQANLDQQRRSLQAAGRAVPATLAVPPLLRQLERVGKASGVSMRTVTQGGGSNDSTGAASGVDSTGFSLIVGGRYANVRKFLTRVDEMVKVSGQKIKGTGRLVSIGSISLAPDTGESKLTATIETKVYTLQDPATLAAGATPGQPTTGDTASAANGAG